VTGPNSEAKSGERPQGPASGPNDEFAAIERLRTRFEAAARGFRPEEAFPPAGETWIGDDAAVVTMSGADQALWATDLVVDRVHFDLDICTPGDVGFKAVMVAVSDLAAMGAWPHYALASVAAPVGTDLDQLGSGMAAAAERAECVIVGGDLSAAPTLVVSVAVLGALRGDPGRAPLLRSGARSGHRLFLTGPLGGSAAGLRILRRGGGPEELAGAGASAAVDAYRRPVARLREGEVARLSGASAAIDVSDGLVDDLRHLAGSSDVGVELDHVPVAEGATESEALAGGEDYELVVATPDPEALLEAFRSAGLRAPVAIGSCTGRPGDYTRDGVPLPEGGWRHRF
jgi:thiamine-monophosphate kinase